MVFSIYKRSHFFYFRFSVLHMFRCSCNLMNISLGRWHLLVCLSVVKVLGWIYWKHFRWDFWVIWRNVCMICSMPGQGGGLKLKELLGKLVLWQWFCKNCSFRDLIKQLLWFWCLLHWTLSNEFRVFVVSKSFLISDVFPIMPNVILWTISTSMEPHPLPPPIGGKHCEWIYWKHTYFFKCCASLLGLAVHYEKCFVSVGDILYFGANYIGFTQVCLILSNAFWTNGHVLKEPLTGHTLNAALHLVFIH